MKVQPWASVITVGLLLLVFNFFRLQSAEALPTTATFQQGVNGYVGGEDNELSSDSPSSVYSSGGSNYTDRIGVRFCGSACNNVLFRFKNISVPGPITNVKLRVKESGQQGTSDFLYARKISRTDWDTSSTTWNNYKSGTAWTSTGGDAAAASNGISAAGSSGGWVTFDLGTNYTLTELQQNGILISTNIPGFNYVWF